MLLRVLLAVIIFAGAAAACCAIACNGSSTPPTEARDAGGATRSEGGARDVHAPPRDGTTRETAGGGEVGAPAPVLEALALTATDGDATTVALVPPFSPHVYDYYVRCAKGPNALAVSMRASAGAASILLQPTVSESRPEQSLRVTVLENDAVVAAATDAEATTEYWIRCLPHDVPDWTWTPHPEAGSPTPGYYLVGNFFRGPGEGGYALVLDSQGVPVWYARAPDGGAADNVDSLTPDVITFDPFGAAIHHGAYEARRLDPPGTTFIAPSTQPPTLHELRVLPGGNYLIIASPPKPGFDLTGRSLVLPDGGLSPLGVETILDCTVMEFTPAGDVVWSWTASDHFGPDALTYLQPAFVPDNDLDGGWLVDGFHCNSIDVDPSNGNLLVSSRDMDSIFYVERSTGAVLWKMGGANSSLDGARFVKVPDPFHRQHDARLMPGWSPTCGQGSGAISLFDDESYVIGAVARAVVYDVVVGDEGGGGGCPEGGPAGPSATAVRAWHYEGLGPSSLAGSFRISADGSRVVDWGVDGTTLVFTEVDVEGHDLLDFAFAAKNASYRAIKLPLSAFDPSLLRSTAGLP
jgi:Arylsulfotransferase (ASST)